MLECLKMKFKAFSSSENNEDLVFIWTMTGKPIPTAITQLVKAEDQETRKNSKWFWIDAVIMNGKINPTAIKLLINGEGEKVSNGQIQ